jgi:hypothetical protein
MLRRNSRRLDHVTRLGKPYAAAAAAKMVAA